MSISNMLLGIFKNIFRIDNALYILYIIILNIIIYFFTNSVYYLIIFIFLFFSLLLLYKGIFLFIIIFGIFFIFVIAFKYLRDNKCTNINFDDTSNILCKLVPKTQIIDYGFTPICPDYWEHFKHGDSNYCINIHNIGKHLDLVKVNSNTHDLDMYPNYKDKNYYSIDKKGSPSQHSIWSQSKLPECADSYDEHCKHAIANKYCLPWTYVVDSFSNQITNKSCFQTGDNPTRDPYSEEYSCHAD